jgi:glycosyltransferase involved in cell wall biosynthesis
MNVHIIQCVIPKYRVPLFNELVKNRNFNFKFYFSCGLKGSPANYLEGAHFSYSFFKAYSFYDFIFIFKGLNFIRNLTKDDILVVEGNMRFLNNYLFLFYSKLKGFKIISWTIYNMPYSGYMNLTFRKLFMNFFDRVILYSEKEKDMVKLSKLVNYSKIGFLNNTIDTSLIQKVIQNCTTNDLNFIKESLNVSNERVLIYVGRLTKKPKLELVLKFLHENDNKDLYKFIIIGDGSEYTFLKDLAFRYDLSKNVIFVGAIYDEVVLSKYMLISDLFIYPGSIGLSIFTSFAYSLPVLTHNRIDYQAPEYYALEDNVNGITYNYGDFESLRTKIEFFFTQSDITYLKANAYETATIKYTIGKMSDNFLYNLNLCR